MNPVSRNSAPGDSLNAKIIPQNPKDTGFLRNIFGKSTSPRINFITNDTKNIYSVAFKNVEEKEIKDGKACCGFFKRLFWVPLKVTIDNDKKWVWINRSSLKNQLGIDSSIDSNSLFLVINKNVGLITEKIDKESKIIDFIKMNIELIENFYNDLYDSLENILEESKFKKNVLRDNKFHPEYVFEENLDFNIHKEKYEKYKSELKKILSNNFNGIEVQITKLGNDDDDIYKLNNILNKIKSDVEKYTKDSEEAESNDNTTLGGSAENKDNRLKNNGLKRNSLRNKGLQSTDNENIKAVEGTADPTLTPEKKLKQFFEMSNRCTASLLTQQYLLEECLESLKKRISST